MKKFIHSINKPIKILLLGFNKILNKLPQWLRNILYFIIYITISIYFKKYTGINIEDLIFNIFVVKSWMWFNVFYVFYNLLIAVIELDILTSNNKISLPKSKYFPNFIVKWYNAKFDFSTYNIKDKEFFILLKLDSIKFYLFCLFFLLIMLLFFMLI